MNFERSRTEIAVNNLAPLCNSRAFLTDFKHVRDFNSTHLSIISCCRMCEPHTFRYSPITSTSSRGRKCTEPRYVGLDIHMIIYDVYYRRRSL